MPTVEIQARRAVAAARARGLLKPPERCQRCQREGKLQAHHGDYSRPLDVEWLCLACHGATRRYDDDFVAPACPRCGDLLDDGWHFCQGTP